MTFMLRIVLICGSVLTTALMIHKIRQSKVQIEDSLFWLFCSILLVIFSVFPKSADILSRLVGTYSTSNFIFLFMIFLLLVKVFSMTIRISQLETRLKELVQMVALEQEKAEEVRQKTEGKKQEIVKKQDAWEQDGPELEKIE
ncbi:DUF2304 domain-containing protein [Lachnospiraceae bacterium 62-35]